MPVEAELSLIVSDRDRTHAALATRARPQRCLYADTYYDRPDRSLDTAGYELRLRTITTADSARTLLTYKQPAIDDAGSKPEHETTVADPKPLHTMLLGLGLVELVAFEKHCTNYQFTDHGRDMLATVVTVPELPGQTFLEIETLVDPDDVPAALDALRATVTDLDLGDTEPSTVSYTDRVEAARRVTDTARR